MPSLKLFARRHSAELDGDSVPGRPAPTSRPHRPFLELPQVLPLFRDELQDVLP